MKPSSTLHHLVRNLALAACALCGAAAQAQTPLRVILPNGAGSGIDVIVRTAQSALSKALGDQPVVIENLPAAGGIPGTTAIVRAAPDGNTMGMVSNNFAVAPSVYKKLPFDPVKDITPIVVVGATPFVMVVNPQKVSAKTARELQAFLKAKPGVYNYASSGNGTIIHLAGAMFVDGLGADLKHIPYKAVGPMITDLISGQVDLGAVALPAVQAHLASGALRAIGVMGRSRLASLPNLPTLVEQGLPDVDVEGWFAFIGPAGLSAANVRRLHDAVVAAYNDPVVKAAMAKQENVINPTTSEAAGQFMRSEQDRFARLAAKIGLQPD